MPLYELSIDASAVREAEKVVSLEGRGFPTLVMQWESRLFDQVWTTTIVLDYLIALPPLMLGQATFNEVMIAAYVGGAPTKFLYFGTEMTSDVPRVAPEMENRIGPAKLYQEFRLEEQSCPVPYLKLIQATPRIYGNGPQDYYSPPIKVERYDGVVGPDQIADAFPAIVANLEPVKGTVLTDPARGFWNGARYMGTAMIAIKRQGKVVGIHRRVGRTDKDALPPEVKKRDPKLDVIKAWAAIDVGTSSTVVALRGERATPELLRIGTTAAAVVPADYESPTEIAFENLGRTVKAWRDRVIFPLTRWEDLVVGQAARALRAGPAAANKDLLPRAAATLTALPLLRDRIDRKEAVKLRGRTDPETAEVLKKPAPPIIDEEGIGAHDPFDPVELYAYYVGLTINQRHRGLCTHYAISMPTGWAAARRQSILCAFRRGLYRSLPAGLVAYDDLEGLEVVDAGPAAIPFVAHAFRAFAIQPKGEVIPFAVLDAGASETGIVFGLYRDAKPEERSNQGFERVIEFLEPSAIPWLAGERMLHRMAYGVYKASEAAVREARIAFEVPEEETPLAGAEELFAPSPEARANTLLLKDAIRPILEGDAASKIPTAIKLLGEGGAAVDVPLSIDRAALTTTLQGWMADGVTAFLQALGAALTKIGRDPDPHDGLHVFLGGRLGMHPYLYERLAGQLPSNVKIHRFKEPDKTNLAAPTVKTATALGILSMRFDRLGAVPRAEKRDAFRYRVGRARHGQFMDVVDPAVEYDEWREMGPCQKPDVDVLFMLAAEDAEVAADDPRVMRSVCSLGVDAVGQRVYLRAVGPARVEVTAGPQGEGPAKGAPVWAVDLKTGLASAIK